MSCSDDSECSSVAASESSGCSIITTDEGNGNDDGGAGNADDVENDGPNVCRGRTRSLTDELSILRRAALVEEGYEKFLYEIFGNTMKARSISEIVRQVSIYLSWLEKFPYKNNIRYLRKRVAQKLCHAYKKKPKSVHRFLLHLESRHCKAMTCLSYINAIRSSINWLAWEFSSKKYRFNSTRINVVMKMCQRKYKREDNVRQGELGDTSAMIEERLWPADGIPTTQKAVHEKMDWAERLVCMSFISSRMSTIIYNHVVYNLCRHLKYRVRESQSPRRIIMNSYGCYVLHSMLVL